MDLKEKIISSYVNQKNEFISFNKYIYKLKNKSIDIFKKNGFPTIKEENWKYTNLLPILKYDYNLFPIQKVIIREKDIQKYFLEDINTIRIVFIDGIYNFSLSNIINDYNNICMLSNIFHQEKYKIIIENYYGKIASQDDPLIALNTAFTQEGTYIYIPKNIFIKNPIQILYFSTGVTKKLMLHPRNLIILEEGANVQIIEQHQSLSDQIVLSNSVTEISLAKDSKIEYFKIQNDTLNSSLIDNTFIIQKENSVCSMNTFTFHGKFIRNNLNFYQYGEKINSYLQGLTMVDGDEVIDHHTMVEHLYPNCNSYEMYKSIFNGKSKGIFNGKILVHSNAQKINAFQKNNNILLSQEASINTKPQLEIFADNVKCSHGCTIGELNLKALFYLCSRGISKKEAKSLLLLAFTEEILKNINVVQIKKYIYKIINKKLNINIEL